jgi:hypothetical protein
MYFIVVPFCSTELFENVRKLSSVLKNIPGDIKPKQNQTEKIEIGIHMVLNSMQDYDEVSGILKMSASFILYWSDEIRNWNTTEYNGLDSIQLPIQNTWIPKIIIRNMVIEKTFYYYDNDIDIKTTYVKYYNTGGARLIVTTVITMSCSADILLFPFDSQECKVQLMAENFDSHVTFQTLSDGVDLQYAETNSEWSIIATSAEIFTNRPGLEQLNYILTLKRHSKFIFLNLVVPIILLSFVNLLVFCIPVTSGERASLAFTILLTFVVFMTMVATMLPANDVISIFNIFLLTQLSCSGLILFCAIWSISLFNNHADGNEKGWSVRLLVNIYTKYKMTCACTNTRKQKENNTTKTNEHRMSDDNNSENQDPRESFETQTISNLSMEFLDSVCFYIFFFVLSLQLITYFAILIYS